MQGTVMKRQRRRFLIGLRMRRMMKMKMMVET